MKRTLSLIVAAALLTVALTALAGDTKRFDIDTFDRFGAGTASGVEIKSSGRLSQAPSVEEIKLDEDSVWSIAAGRGGDLYLGTGNNGKLYRLAAGALKEVAKVDRVMITRVRADAAGQIWFVAVPEAVLYKLEGDKAVKVADVGETYAWDFAFVGNEIYLATGPKGRIVRLSRDGKKLGAIETGEQHVMCLLQAGDGNLYAGTSGEGLLLEVKPGGYRIVYDFDEKEVKALAWVEEDKALVAAVNVDGAGRMPDAGPSGPPSAPPGPPRPPVASGVDPDDKSSDDQPAAPIIIMPSAAPRGRGRTSGAVYARIGGGMRKLFDLPKRAAVDLAVAGHDVYVGTDQEGKVYKCRATRSDYSIAFDLEPAQALALVAGKSGLEWIGAGSPGRLFKVKSSLGGGSYTTDVLDAHFPSRWGEIDYIADGQLRILTRSGAVSDTNRGWSDWEAAGPGRPAAVRSPDARYLQVKVEWLPASNTVLRAISVPYRVYNQAAFIDSIQVEAIEQDREKAAEEARAKNPNGVRGPVAHSTVRKLAWKVTNPDNDPLLFELYFQSEKMDEWVRIPTPAPIIAPKFEWQTESLPDGWYRLKIVATDLPANSAAEALKAEAVSELFLVDNGRPEVRVAVAGRKATGKAVDSFSGILGVQYAIDGGDWNVAAADDGVLDSPEESFSIELPEGLAAGPHILSVRAWDRAGNIGATQEKFGR